MYRWLTTLLLYCMSHPGVLLSVLYSRFNMMAPVHLYYLLEILQGYGCVNMFSMEVRQKRSLFSTYRPPKVGKIVVPFPYLCRGNVMRSVPFVRAGHRV